MNKIQRYRYQLLMISIGIMYLWFGSLKFIPNLSPADALAKQTITLLTFGLIPSNISILLLAAWEVAIGILLILRWQVKTAVILALVHLVFTFTPFLLLPNLSFRSNILELTLVGQYIIKNLVIVSALLFIYPEAKQIRQVAAVHRKKEAVMTM